MIPGAHRNQASRILLSQAFGSAAIPLPMRKSQA